MQKNTLQEQIYTEDEIDLKELFLTISKHKKLIIFFTFIITSLAAVYVYIKTPIYVASAIVEIGNYKQYNNCNSNSNSNSNRIVLDKVSKLSKELNILFIDMHKNDKNVDAKIVSINVPKKQKELLSIKAEGISNEIASKKIEEIIAYVQLKHKKILDDVKERNKFEIMNIESKIDNIKNKELSLLNSKIEYQKESLKNYIDNVAAIDKNVQKLQKKNPTLVALELMKKSDLLHYILEINLQISDLEEKKNNLEINTILDLEEKKNILTSMLLPHNYQNSHIVGSILTNDYPEKPKKKLILIVSFITGLILSIFLVFFLEFIRSIKEDEGH